jgi:hypothetical protein
MARLRWRREQAMYSVECSASHAVKSGAKSSTYTADICHDQVDRAEVCLRAGAAGVMKESN